MDLLSLSEERCRCGKLLFKGIFFNGTLEIKCRRCGRINKIGSLNLVDDATNYLLIINEKNIIINASKAAGYVLGYSCDELIGKHFSQIQPKSPSIANKENYFRLDTFHQTKSGKKIPVITSLKLYEPTYGKKYLLVSAEPKNLETKKNFTTHNATKFIHNTCDLYLNLDEDGIIKYISPSTKKFRNFLSKAMIGRNFFDLLPIKTKTKSKKIWEHFSINGEPYRDVNSIELFFAPNFIDSGKFIGYCVLGWEKSPEFEK